jgi:gas vesicle protein
MFSRVRIAIRFFFVGLAVGILLAPRSGEETRRLVREKADRLLNDVLDAATLGTADLGTGEGGQGATATRGGNGSRTRSTRAKAADTAAGTETAASEAGV